MTTQEAPRRMGRPPHPKPERRTHQLTMMIEPSLLSRIDDQVALDGFSSRALWVRLVLDQHLTDKAEQNLSTDIGE